MKKISIILFLILFFAAPALADSVVTVTEIAVDYSTNRSTVNWSIQAPELFSPFFPKNARHDFNGFGTSAVPQIVCQSPCNPGSTLAFNLMVSGLQLEQVRFQGVNYPTIYLSGVLNLDTKSFVLQPGVLNYQVSAKIFGNLTGCSDPDCKDPLFPMVIALRGGTAVLTLNPNSSGGFDVSHAYFFVPEPASVAMFGTGSLLVLALFYKSRRSAPAPTS